MNALEKKRGRPRAFDPVGVLEHARAVFLRFGYAGASLDALTQAMGLNKPSLYAAFGDKRGLFRHVIEARTREIGRRYRAAFTRGHSVESSLREIFDEAIAINLVEGEPSGCIVGSSAATEAAADPELASFVREYFTLCDREVGRWFDEAYGANGAIRGVGLGRLVTGVIHDLALRARIGESKARLREYAKDATVALAKAAT